VLLSAAGLDAGLDSAGGTHWTAGAAAGSGGASGVLAGTALVEVIRAVGVVS